MSRIYDLPFLYRIGKKYVVFIYKNYYNKITITGTENIPETGPVIFAPNHLNALMDDMAVLMFASKKHSTVYLGRADMFKKPLVARFLRFAKIMPAFRIRDGYENLKKNTETFDESAEVLKNGHALCIMPEGNQELERKVRPLVKGIFRIAFTAQNEIGEAKNVTILPVGLDYEHFIRFGKNLTINIGKPINVSDYINDFNENQAKAINEIKDKLKFELNELTVNLDTVENYELFELVFNIITSKAAAEKIYNATDLFKFRKQTAKSLINIEKHSPEKITKLKDLSNSYLKSCEQLKLNPLKWFAQQIKLKDLFFKGIYFTICSPLFFCGLILNILPFTLPLYIRKIVGIKFPGFFSTVYYGAGIITFPLFYILQSILLTTLFHWSWWIFIVLIPLQYFLGKFAFFAWYRRFNEYIKAVKLKSLKQKNQINYNRLISIIEDLKDSLSI